MFLHIYLSYRIEHRPKRPAATTGYASASRLTGVTYLELPHGDCFLNVETYKLSTLSLAHCVLRKNFRDDLIDGSLLKQLMLIL